MSFACTAASHLVSGIGRCRGGWHLRAGRTTRRKVAAEREEPCTAAGVLAHLPRPSHPQARSLVAARPARAGARRVHEVREVWEGRGAARKAWGLREALDAAACKSLPSPTPLPLGAREALLQLIGYRARGISRGAARGAATAAAAACRPRHPPCTAHPPASQLATPMRSVVAKAMTVRGSQTAHPGDESGPARASPPASRRLPRACGTRMLAGAWRRRLPPPASNLHNPAPHPTAIRAWRR